MVWLQYVTSWPSQNNSMGQWVKESLKEEWECQTWLLPVSTSPFSVLCQQGLSVWPSHRQTEVINYWSCLIRRGTLSYFLPTNFLWPHYLNQYLFLLAWFDFFFLLKYPVPKVFVSQYGVYDLKSVCACARAHVWVRARACQLIQSIQAEYLDYIQTGELHTQDQTRR